MCLLRLSVVSCYMRVSKLAYSLLWLFSAAPLSLLPSFLRQCRLSYDALPSAKADAGGAPQPPAHTLWWQGSCSGVKLSAAVRTVGVLLLCCYIVTHCHAITMPRIALACCLAPPALHAIVNAQQHTEWQSSKLQSTTGTVTPPPSSYAATSSGSAAILPLLSDRSSSCCCCCAGSSPAVAMLLTADSRASAQCVQCAPP